MKSSLLADNIKIEKYDTPFGFTGGQIDVDYAICQVDVEDSVQAKALIDKGFVFLERVLLFEINLTKFQTSSTNILPDIMITHDADYSADLEQIAKAAYKTDRRFHLDYVFNAQRAAPVIEAYIKQCRSENMMIYKAWHESTLLGYTIIDESVDEKGIYFENVLGVTVPGIKGKMAASKLYESMLDGEKDRFKKYVGRVSSSNIASINLHFQLGGKVTRIYDEYIYRAIK